MVKAGVEEEQGSLDSYITGLRARAKPEALWDLRPGTELRLRPSGGRGSHRLEVCTSQGEPLGWLPVEDSLALTESRGRLRGLSGRVTALVPARMLPRVHIRVFTNA
jgi:hypothetical protein